MTNMDIVLACVVMPTVAEQGCCRFAMIQCRPEMVTNSAIPSDQGIFLSAAIVVQLLYSWGFALIQYFGNNAIRIGCFSCKYTYIGPQTV